MIKKDTFIKNNKMLFSYLRNEISNEKSKFQSNVARFKSLKIEKNKSLDILNSFQNRKAPLITRLPLLRKLTRKEYLRKYNEAIYKTQNYKSQLETLKKQIIYNKSQVMFLKKTGKAAKHNYDYVVSNYEYLDKEIHFGLTRFVNKIEFIKRKLGSENKLPSSKIINELHVITAELHQQIIKSAEMIEKKKAKEVENKASSKSNDKKEKDASSSEVRVYLPIPISLRHEAKRLGAQYDHNASFGSRMYVDLNGKETLQRLQHLLPEAYRTNKKTFKFPPIRYHAKGQNIWTIFTKDTWNYIRSMMYSQTGNRCMICGSQGGKIIDSVFEDESNKKTSVECHEVWNWEVPDPKNGIGIQKLEKLMVLCVDCHMMFHEDYAVNKAEKFGKGEKVQGFLEKRKMLVNSMNREQIRLLDEAEKEKFAETNGIDKWIIDLSNLAAQDFMQNHTPVLKSDNEAVVSEDLIAGINFENEYGDIFESTSSVEMYSKIVSEIDKELYESSDITVDNTNNNDAKYYSRSF